MNDPLVKCLCGISDEAGMTLDEQMAAHRELGWNLIELRAVDGERVTEVSNGRFSQIASALRANGLRTVVINTGIGGEGRTASSPLWKDLEELDKAAERATLVGCKFLQIMSFPNDGLGEGAWQQAALEKIERLTERARVVGVVLLHENGLGWASQGPDRTLEMLRTIDSPHLRLLFDMATPVASGKDSMTFLDRVAGWVEHVHVA